MSKCKMFKERLFYIEEFVPKKKTRQFNFILAAEFIKNKVFLIDVKEKKFGIL